MKIDCIEKRLSLLFERYGRFVARNPWPFLLIPIIVSVGLTCGVVLIEEVTGTEDLYTPRDGPAKDEREVIQSLFPENDTHFFEPTRRSELLGYMRIAIAGIHQQNIFTPEAIDEIIQIDTLVKTYEVNHKGKKLIYNDVCGKWNGVCTENHLLELIAFDANNTLTANLTYPVHNQVYFLGMQIGGVDLDEYGTIRSADAVLLSYFVTYQSDKEMEEGDAWIAGISKHLLEIDTGHYMYVSHALESSLSMDEELSRATGGIIPFFSIAYTILMTFAAISTSMKDWVRCKTWVAIGGEISVVMAVGSSLGFLSLCGVSFTSTVGTMPFLIVGIGLDDMFVLVSSWRHTNYLLSVEERIGKTCEKAAVSITLTSFTDALAFGIGAYTSFLSIELFCLYTLMAVVFCYVYAITFLLACMVFSGQREEKNKHVFTCRKATPQEQAEGKSTIFKVFCVGGDHLMEDESEKKIALEKNEEKLTVPQLSTFLGTTYANLLIKTPTKVFVLFLYLVYLGCSVWGCVTLDEGLQLQNLAPDDSYLADFYDIYNPYFISQWGPRTMVVVDERLDYSNSDVSQSIHNIIQEFQESDLYSNDDMLTSSWLRDFQKYLSLTGRSPQNMSVFTQILTTEFLGIPQFEHYKLDINFNEDQTDIIAARYLVQAKGIENAIQEKELALKSRNLAENQPYPTTSYHAAFIFYDQYVVVVTNTIRNLCIAAACMLVVSIVLLPHPLAVLWVTASVISISVGVVGFMTFWDVNLDSISMINLIMCIGFSVDFSGHICYHFTVSDQVSSAGRLKEALQHLGLPILQGGISTILGVFVLAFSDSYIFRTFFKLVFLVMVFGLFHAMVVLPVVLSVIGPGCCSKQTSPENLNEMNNIRSTDQDTVDTNHPQPNNQSL